MGNQGKKIAPEARKIIARSFNCGFAVEKMKSPVGATESRNAGIFCRPCGAWFVLDVLPAVETAGYFRSSLCDFYGARRSRWDWWSRFQRLKAASLVSVK